MRSPFRRIALATSALTLLAGAASAAGAPSPMPDVAPRSAARAAPAAAGDTVLKRLPADREGLTFRGENATRSWTVTLGRSEAARTTIFQMALVNAVSTLPERSIVRIAINGMVVASVPAASPDKASVMPIRIPAGVLVPGVNTIQVSAALSHRVDCSIKATYELWATLDPAQTGFLVPREAALSARSMDDLALEPLAEDGTTRIHLRLAEGAEPATIATASRFVNGLVRRADLPRPIVDVGPDLGQGPGFDVMVASGPAASGATTGLTIVSRSDLATLARDPASGRLVVILTGASDEEVDRKLGDVARDSAAVPRRAGATLAQGFRKTFAQLGLPTETFGGRHYAGIINVDLPPDFLAANDRARLLIDGAHSAALVEGSALVFRVNGTLVSTLPLTAGVAERFQHAVVELPLRFFHPGHNELSIEGMTSATYDQGCDLATMPREARLTLAGSSEFDFPDFAHLVAMPQIPAAMAYDSAPDGGPVHLYLTDADAGSMGAGLTVLANMAVTQPQIGVPIVHLGGPSGLDAPGVVIAPADQLPETLAGALRKVSTPVDAAPAAAVLPPARGATADAMADGLPAEPKGDTPTVVAGDDLSGRADALVAATESLLRSRGFFFTFDRKADLLPVSATSMLIAAVTPRTAAPAFGGLELPQLTRDPAHWLVVTAPDAKLYEEGVRRLVAGGDWPALAGEAVSFDLSDASLRTLQPHSLSYVVPNRFVPSDVRPIIGGIISDNIILGIAFLMLLMSVLGVSTHALIRRMGVR